MGWKRIKEGKEGENKEGKKEGEKNRGKKKWRMG